MKTVPFVGKADRAPLPILLVAICCFDGLI
jgi:hypothetical protein